LAAASLGIATTSSWCSSSRSPGLAAARAARGGRQRRHHSHAEVTAWLANHPRITLHFTPTSASWMNQVETFFGLLTRQALRRGSFASVPDLVTAQGSGKKAVRVACPVLAIDP
jgi:hypothetical protein